jgi:FAD:protein FMN transferase
VSAEARRSFACFGGTVTVLAGDPDRERAERAVAAAERRLLDAHERLSRFLPESELCRLNRDPRGAVPVSRLLLEVAASARWAGLLSDGLVDATLLGELERAGYRQSLAGERNEPENGWPSAAAPTAAPASPGPAVPAPAAASPSAAVPAPAPASPSPTAGWRQIAVDRDAGAVSRPPGLRIDSGGIAKGLLADLVGATLQGLATFAVDCCGDVRVGGAAGRPRKVLVEDPSGGEPLRELEITAGGVATSGIGRRAWTGARGPAHHLLDPASGEPAFTGVAQATAQAPNAFLAEVYAKWALLSGPDAAPSRLPYGGVLVLDDGSVEEVSAGLARPTAEAVS